MEKSNNKKYLIILSCIIVLAFFIRFYNITKYPLWNDEGETAINAFQVLEVGYPHSIYRGEPLYENFLWLPSESEKYQYSQTNYQGTIYEKNKGWLTFYYLALIFKFFGVSTLTARLPFVFISLISIIFIYLLGKELYSKKIGILASLFYAINFLLIVNERQVRYYAVFVFLIIISLYFYQKLITTNYKKYYWWLTASLILLFYTHIISWIITIVFFLVHWLFVKKKQINLQYLISGLVIFLFTLPWIIFVKFWTVLGVSPSFELKIIWLVFIATIFSIYLIINNFLIVFFKNKIITLEKISLINLFILFYIIIIPFIMPQESFSLRAFLPVIALLNLSLASKVIEMINQKKLAKVVVVVLLIFIIVQVSIYYYQDKEIYFAQWVRTASDYLNNENFSSEIPVFVNFHQFAFIFYTPYKVQNIQVIRKEYLDNYNKELYIILNNFSNCILNDRQLCQDEFLNYRDIIKKCDLKILDNEIYIYHCFASD